MGVLVTTAAVQRNFIQRESPIIQKSKNNAALLDSCFAVTKESAEGIAQLFKRSLMSFVSSVISKKLPKL